MDVIENVVRSLIKEGKLTRARALLSVFQDEYPQLVFELEEASGNFEEALKAFEKMPDDLKKIYEQRAEQLKSRLKKDYKADFRDAVAEMEKKNYEGAFALLEGITKDYPELVEAVALKLEIARRRGDRTRAQSLEELLEALDSTHPSLMSKKTTKRKEHTFGAFEYTVVIISAVILAVSLMALFSIPSKAFIEEKLAGVSRSQIVKAQVNLKPVENKIDENYKKLESSIENLKAPQISLDDIEKVVSRVLDEKLKSIKVTQAQGQQNQKVVSASVDLKPLVERLSSLEREIKDLKKSVSGYITPAILPGEKVYKPSSELDTAKIYWLAGYIMYLRGDFKTAVNLFQKSLNIVDKKFPHVYFHDDCYYYLALSYYVMGDRENARKYFENFIKKFPKSGYVEYAKIFLKKIGR